MWRAQAMSNRRRRNNVGAYEIAHAIHQMVDTMQPIARQPRAMVAPTCFVTMEDFMRHRPAKFSARPFMMRQMPDYKSARKFVELLTTRMHRG